MQSRRSGDGNDVVFVVWKARRNRVAVFTGPLDTDKALDFLDSILAGNAKFTSVKGDFAALLQMQAQLGKLFVATTVCMRCRNVVE